MNSRSRISPSPRERIGSAAAVAVVTGALGWLLLNALALHAPSRLAQGALAAFDVAPPPPPPPPPERPRPQRIAHRAREAPAPAGRHATPTPVVAPTPVVVLPVPPLVITAPVPGIGAAPSAGAADQGSGTGAGGVGNGRGGGGDDEGGDDVRLVRRLRRGDLPNAARRLNGVRTVGMRWIVGVDGRIHDCRVTRSSGDPTLDGETCALLTDRLRYAPAHDAAGHKVPVTIDDAEQRWEVFHGGNVDAEGTDDG